MSHLIVASRGRTDGYFRGLTGHNVNISIRYRQITPGSTVTPWERVPRESCRYVLSESRPFLPTKCRPPISETGGAPQGPHGRDGRDSRGRSRSGRRDADIRARGVCL